MNKKMNCITLVAMTAMAAAPLLSARPVHADTTVSTALPVSEGGKTPMVIGGAILAYAYGAAAGALVGLTGWPVGVAGGAVGGGILNTGQYVQSHYDASMPDTVHRTPAPIAPGRLD